MNNLFKHLLLPELRIILGRYWINLWVLTLIVFFAILSIGIANTSMLYLKQKMDSPFIKYVNVFINRGNKVNVSVFQNDNLKKHYGYKSIKPIKKINLSFSSKDQKKYKDASIEVVSNKSEFYMQVLCQKPVLISDDIRYDDSSISCIVTQDFLRKLGYSDNNISFIHLIISSKADTVPIRVAGVVSQLPRYTDIIVNQLFYDYYFKEGFDLRNDIHKEYVQYFLPDISKMPEELDGFSLKEITNTHLLHEGIIIASNNINQNDINSITNKLNDLGVNYIRIYDYSKVVLASRDVWMPDPSYFAFSFVNMDSIIPFKNYLYNDFNLRIDMNTIKAKQNYDFFNKLSNLLSNGLILFSIIAILFFTINLLLNHIDKTKRNLGTLKAFGLDNKSVIFIYTLISLILVTIAFGIAYILSSILGDLVLSTLIQASKIRVDGSIVYENIHFAKLLFTFTVVPLFIILGGIYSKLRKATPGDLIYDR
jgi:ABC-type antimicrobial peptide transport system permease subunit